VAFLLVVLLRAGLRAAAFLAEDFRRVVFRRAGAFLAEDFRRVVFRRVVLRAVVFLAVDFRLAGLRAVVFLAADFLLAGLRAAVFAGLRAAVFFRVVRFAADRLAAGRLRAAVFLAAIPSPFPSRDSPKDLDLRRHPLEAPPLPFAHSAPDAVPLVTTERVVEALDPNGTLRADALGLP
jgi:hypothetical protein